MSFLAHRKSFATKSSVHAVNLINYIVELHLKYAGLFSADYDPSLLFHTGLSWLRTLLLDFSQLQVSLPTEKSHRNTIRYAANAGCCNSSYVLVLTSKFESSLCHDWFSTRMHPLGKS